MEALIANRVVVCPTLGLITERLPPPVLDAIAELMGMTWQSRVRLVGGMHGAGVLIASGTDAGVGRASPHGVLPRAISDLVVGVSRPLKLSRAQRRSRHGRVGWAIGKAECVSATTRDLLLVNGNPPADISALHRVSAVMLRGTMIDIAA